VREAGADRRVLCTGLAHTMKGQNEHQGRGAQEQTQTPCRVLPGSNARDEQGEKQGKRNFISIRSIAIQTKTGYTAAVTTQWLLVCALPHQMRPRKGYAMNMRGHQ
jgi:hypothetical protein